MLVRLTSILERAVNLGNLSLMVYEEIFTNWQVYRTYLPLGAWFGACGRLA